MTDRISADRLVTAAQVAASSGDRLLAERCYREALALVPEHVEALVRLGVLYASAGQFPGAIEIWSRLHALRPDSVETLADLTHMRQQVCDWRGLDGAAAAIRRHVESSPRSGVSPFFFMMLPGSTPLEQRQCAQKWARSNLARAMERRPAVAAVAPRPAGTRRRIGYLSGDFHAHATLHLLAPVLEAHDRSRFEIVAFSYGREADDAMRRRLLAACDEFVNLRTLDDVTAARAIRERGIDLLIDAKGYTRDARPGILALRPAPRQAGYLVYPGTCGTDFLDFLIADRYIVPPELAGAYSERVLYLSGAYHSAARATPVASPSTRADCGLPERGFVFCCFNQPYKITPQVFDVWCRLLAAVPQSVLWLWMPHPHATDNLLREAAARGIAGNRLVFARTVDTASHLARLANADLFLDTLPCNAHTTASDALAAGVPLVTCSGETFVSRVAGSLLHSAGLPELVTTSLQDYERIARELALNPPALAEIRGRLMAARTIAPLFSATRITRELERLYDAVCRGDLPAAV